MRRCALLPLALAAGLAAGPAAGLDLSIGLGAGIAPDYEGSDDYTAVPLWNLRLQNLYHPTTYVALEGLTLKSNLLPHPSFRLGPAAQYVRGRSDVDDSRVDDMQNIGSALMLGLVGGYDHAVGDNRFVFVEGFGRQAVSDDNGFLGTLAVGYRGGVAPQLRLRTTLSTTWASEDYMGEYFGVTDANARRSGLDSFDADAGFKDLTLAAGITYDLTPSWNASLLGSYARLLSDAKDSPIVDDRGSPNQLFIGGTVGYRV